MNETVLQFLLDVPEGIVAILAAGAVTYLLLAVICCARFPAGQREADSLLPAVTLLKPLCGAEADLDRALRSFFVQQYDGDLQIVFGVRTEADPAVAVARDLMAEFPEVDATVVVDATVHGPNLKVSNLLNMMRAARHQVLVVSDSDTVIGPDGLNQVVASLADPSVGAATCLFRGRPATGSGRVGQLGALYIDGWFLPSAVIDATFSSPDFCFGPLTALRRDVFEAAGGFGRLTHALADDTELGHLTVEQGYRVAFAPLAIDTIVPESRLADLLQHELRWARTTRALRPVANLGQIFTFAQPVILVGFLASPSLWLGLMTGLVAALRVVLVGIVDLKFGRSATSRSPTPWGLVYREFLCCGVWLMAFAGRQISWRGRRLAITGQARLAPDAITSGDAFPEGGRGVSARRPE